MLTEERLYFLSFRENEVEYVLLTKESKNVDSRIAYSTIMGDRARKITCGNIQERNLYNTW